VSEGISELPWIAAAVYGEGKTSDHWTLLGWAPQERTAWPPPLLKMAEIEGMSDLRMRWNESACEKLHAQCKMHANGHIFYPILGSNESMRLG
jgi:hypothetical protein